MTAPMRPDLPGVSPELGGRRIAPDAGRFDSVFDRFGHVMQPFVGPHHVATKKETTP